MLVWISLDIYVAMGSLFTRYFLLHLGWMTIIIPVDVKVRNNFSKLGSFDAHVTESLGLRHVSNEISFISISVTHR